MGMGYGFGNDRDALKRRDEILRERYGPKPEPAPVKRKAGRPKGAKTKKGK